MIINIINNDIIKAIKENFPLVRDTLRFAKSFILKEAKDNKKEVTDEICIKVLKRLVKQNNEALEFKQDTKLKTEIAIFNKYIPKMLNEKDTKHAIDIIIKDNNIDNIKHMGKIMSELRKKHGETIDMSLASKITKNTLK